MCRWNGSLFGWGKLTSFSSKNGAGIVNEENESMPLVFISSFPH
jgi:hypothetical protein